MKNDFATSNNSGLPDYFNLFGVARSYVDSMFVMMSSNERLELKDDGALAWAVMFLGGNAVELYLKAYLEKKGVKSNGIKAHDLVKLSSLCRENNFKDIDNSKIMDLIKLFAKPHKEGQFRYIKNKEYERQLCHLPTFFDWFSALDSVVAEAVGACHHQHGRSGDKGWKFQGDEPNWRVTKALPM